MRPASARPSSATTSSTAAISWSRPTAPPRPAPPRASTPPWCGAEAPLRACLEALLPLDVERRRDWRIWFAFWALATADQALAAEQVERVRSAQRRLTAVLEQERAEGRVQDGLDLPDVAHRLLVLVHGVGTQAVFDDAYWTRARQQAAVVAELAGLAPGPLVA